jgi:hypothetical protein
VKSEYQLFYFARSRKQQAKVAAFNMIFAPVMFGLFLTIVRSSDRFDEFLNIIGIILIVTELVLLSLIAWLLKNPAEFYIKLSRTEFTSYHPMFKEWTFSVDPFDIIEIKQSTDQDAMMSSIQIQMQDGTSHVLSPNFAYDRKKLYQSLASLNPAIVLPKHVGLFRSARTSSN